MPQESILIYFAGPMASGKSALRAHFDARAQGQALQTAFQDSNLEKTYQLYKTALSRQIKSEFSFYKQSLPEFAASENNFTIIRPEAAALNEATIQLATELKAHTILKETGSGDMEQTITGFKQDYDKVIVIGATAEPALNAERLNARNAQLNETTSNAELAKTIKDFSTNKAFNTLAKHADFSVLIDTNTTEYNVIYAAENGVQTHTDAKKFDQFKSYGHMSEAQLLNQFGAPKNE